MDAFTSIKHYIPDKNDSLAKTIIKSFSTVPQYIYVPGSFKAIIDLEIDVSARSGAYLQKCARCGDYYIRDEEYDFDYCSRIQREGSTCLELMKIDDPELLAAVSALTPERDEEEDEHDKDEPKIVYVDKETVTAKMDALYKEMAARVNVDMTQRDFSIWYQRELRLKDDILLGEAGEKQLNEFIELSRGDAFASKKQQPLFDKKNEDAEDEDEEEEEEEVTENGKHIKKFVFEKVDRETTTSPISPSPNSAAAKSTLEESEKATMDAVRKLLAANRPKTQGGAQAPGQARPYRFPGQNYDPAGVQAYSYPSQYNQGSQQQPSQPPQQQIPGAQGFAAARQGYAAGQFGQQPPSGNVAFQPVYQPPQTQQVRPAAPTTSRIIKGGSQQAQEIAARSRTVVIPNGDEGRPSSFVSQVKQSRDAERKSAVEGTSQPAGRSARSYGRSEDDPIMVQEEDIKVFIPRRNNIFESGQTDEFIEPSPYEKLRQSIEEFSRDKSDEQEEVDGQLSADDIVKPTTPAPASAVAAYRGYGASGGTSGSGGEAQGEKADFSQILEGITRDDGFSREENLVDSDGLPVSHKTKHVMNALFGPSKASPILRVNLDDDDDE